MAIKLRHRSYSPLRRREAYAGLLFVLPWIASLLVFTSYPIIAAFYFSFTRYNIIEPPKWVGLENYRTMFSNDPYFWISVKNSLYYALVSVPLSLVIALLLALLLNANTRFIGMYRTLFYLPALVPPVAGTIVFILMFSPEGGLLNSLLRMVGLPEVGWLTDPRWSKPALIILSLWGVGTSALIFLAGLKEVPRVLLEAAEIDGAGAWQKFRHVTVPLLSPVILFNLVMGVIYSFQVFTPAFVIGGTTGEPLDSTLMFMVLIYRNAFRYFSMGYASALAVILFLAVLFVTLVIFRSARVWVYYEGGER
ncbi:binding-protein-dependent transport systems inner membrane component [Thermobaculum terrenum ATCC BAA-798]|uniref:Binding-protein-dependent transport systems inner membrane component n=1 Tax=Thermobaculum terrenum (strain ATCC BAA-798 / CCMEE 7001 / YNP1) TaxID=525904 RepID=D1CH16_THET1|nr:sugar ABC transporter permease [Thermobaculum terrenum]ACZ43037.1 binding-protein-dependent transport systems inner membrane component [Thermobaculum terrenum ATCC BAA-798]